MDTDSPHHGVYFVNDRYSITCAVFFVSISSTLPFSRGLGQCILLLALRYYDMDLGGCCRQAEAVELPRRIYNQRALIDRQLRSCVCIYFRS
jgi:hypothetical protein